MNVWNLACWYSTLYADTSDVCAVVPPCLAARATPQADTCQVQGSADTADIPLSWLCTV